jgi:Reverse transcriptase (RNA-dependent DNA polymerase)/Endonuclease-reverse transcriptase
MNSSAHNYNIKIVAWNANGLREKRNEFHQFLIDENIDIALVSETHLKGSFKINFANYKTYRNDRLIGAGGGTAIFIKSSIKHNETLNHDYNRFEVTSLEIWMTTGSSFIIHSVYTAPNPTYPVEDLQTLFNYNKPIFAAGDFNSKHREWNCRATNRNGKTLRGFILSNNINLEAPVVPTHHSTRGASDILDIGLTKDLPSTTIDVHNELSSDHNPVVYKLQINSCNVNSRSTKILWHFFPHYIEKNLPESRHLNNTNDIDAEIETLQGTIKSSIDKCTIETVKTYNDPLPQSIKDKIKHKNSVKRMWQNSRVRSLKILLNKLEREIKHAVYEYNNDTWNSKLNDLKAEDNSLWNLSKVLRKTPTEITKIKCSANSFVFSTEDKAEAIADSIENQCSVNLQRANLQFINKITHIVNRNLKSTSDESIIIEESELELLLRALKNRKSPGIDQIPNFALKILPSIAKSFFLNIINASFSLNYFPNLWKQASVVVLKKPGTDPTLPSSYRPISLLPAMSKIFEKMIQAHLLEHVEKNNIIPREQFGFRRAHSSVHQLDRVVGHIERAFDNRMSTGALFLDIEKAFDKVWHDGLIFKLFKFKFPLHLIKLIKSFLSNRSFRVKLGTFLSNPRPISAGVPQGSILGPLLFSIFTSDFPTKPTRNNITALFADDTAILCSYKNPHRAVFHLQNKINLTTKWFDKWLITVNPLKSVAVMFSRRRKLAYAINNLNKIKINNEPLSWDKQAKYLGLTLDSKLSWKPHIDKITLRTKATRAQLNSLLKRKSKLNIKNKLLLFKTIIRPGMSYAFPVWGHVLGKKRYAHKLQAQQNISLRMATNAPWFVRNSVIHRDLNIDSLEDHFLHLLKKYRENVKSHPNGLVKNILDSHSQ